MRPWEGIIPPEEIEIYAKSGFGHKGGLGGRPAILIIDVQYRTVGPERAPIQEAMKTYPTACGEYGWRAVDGIRSLLAGARRLEVPVFYPYVAPKEAYDAGSQVAKAPTLMSKDAKAYEFVAEVAPAPGDVLVAKRSASAFFGTSLASYLIGRGIDTVLVCGCTTSGCVRASVLDASSYNFKVAVVEECVYDRSQVSHAVNLFDMQAKYADVISLAEAIGYLDGIKAKGS